ncbi:fibronectin type III-like domain-contianing protein [Caulobacter segnis]
MAQVYVDGPAERPEGLTFAPRILAAFQRVALRAGEVRQIHMTIERRALSYRSPQAEGWRPARPSPSAESEARRVIFRCRRKWGCFPKRPVPPS